MSSRRVHCNALVRGALLLLGATTPLAPRAGPLDALPAGRWYEFPDSRMDVARPPGTDAGSVAAVMLAWGSGIFDTDRDRLVVWGGGHNDYAGNEVYAFGPVNGPAPHWTRLTDPSNPPAVNTPHAPDGRPVSRHTYNLLTYLPAPRHRMMSCAIGSQHSNGFGVGGVDFYDFTLDGFSAQPWSQGPTAPSNSYAIAGLCIKHPTRDEVWYHDNGSNSARLQRYDLVDGTWSTHADFDLGGSYATPAIDAVRDLLVVVGARVDGSDGVTLAWDLANPEQQPFRPASSDAPAILDDPAPGFVYDPLDDRFIAWSGGADVYSLELPADPRTGRWRWQALPIDAGNSVLPTGIARVPGDDGYDTGTYGRFRYVPSAHGVIVVNATDENVYFYKLPRSGSAEDLFADGFE
jgi:hypothetical protein